MPQFILAHCVRMVYLVPEDQEGGFVEIFHGEQGVEFRFGFGEAFVVFGVDEEDDAADFGEVVAPEAAGWRGERRLVGCVVVGGGGRREDTLLMASEVKGCESVIADGEFF